MGRIETIVVMFVEVQLIDQVLLGYESLFETEVVGIVPRCLQDVIRRVQMVSVVGLLKDVVLMVEEVVEVACGQRLACKVNVFDGE